MPEPEREERRRGFFRRMRENMRKTREALSAEVQATLFQGDLDEDTWERLEEALIYADVGARTTAQVVAQLEQEAEEGDLVGGEALTARLAELLAKLARTGEDTIDLRHEPAVILVVGVNGTGKTTSIGKLAWHLRKTLGLTVVDRRRRHLPRRGGRAARALGRARRRRPRQGRRRAPTRARSPSTPSPAAASAAPTS